MVRNSWPLPAVIAPFTFSSPAHLCDEWAEHPELLDQDLLPSSHASEDAPHPAQGVAREAQDEGVPFLSCHALLTLVPGALSNRLRKRY
jgi:hypothetical protein